jgi:hypothetical protein
VAWPGHPAHAMPAKGDENKGDEKLLREFYWRIVFISSKSVALLFTGIICDSIVKWNFVSLFASA